MIVFVTIIVTEHIQSNSLNWNPVNQNFRK